MQDYKKLKVWESSHNLTKRLYEVTSCFPKEELYGLTSQVRRAGSSIPTNITEGCGRNSPSDFAHFLQISLGSTFELEYLCFLSF